MKPIIILVIHALILAPACKRRVEHASNAKVINDSYKDTEWFKSFTDQSPDMAELLSSFLDEQINRVAKSKWKGRYFLYDEATGERKPVSDPSGVNFGREKGNLYFTTSTGSSAFRVIVTSKAEKRLSIEIYEYHQKDLSQKKNGIVIPIDRSGTLAEYRKSLKNGVIRLKSFLSRVTWQSKQSEEIRRAGLVEEWVIALSIFGAFALFSFVTTVSRAGTTPAGAIATAAASTRVNPQLVYAGIGAVIIFFMAFLVGKSRAKVPEQTEQNINQLTEYTYQNP